MKNKDFLKSIIVLVAICVVIGASMAAVNMVTKGPIAEAQKKKETDALNKVIEINGGFEKIEEISDLPESVVAVYRDKDGEGIAMLLAAKGYDSSNPISIAVGFDNSGVIEKCYVISCNGETSGIGTKVKGEGFLDSFTAKSDTSEVDTISGATISSSAFVAAVEDACELFARVAESEDLT
ncbi:MAG: FMN-binding protein [Clostridia bacterium]|nr:FMN-binding protein [Clostridia bacterium]